MQLWFWHDVLLNTRLSLSSVRRGRNVATTARPVDMNILALRVLFACKLGLNAEGVGSEIITLGLEHICWEVLSPDAVVEGQSGGEGGCWDAPKCALGDDVTPARLRLVDGLVEEVIKEQVLQVWVCAVGLRDILKEDGSDDTATTPHESDLGFLELPVVFLGGLE
jgi:hypothetical protein